ncbi:hypothetical protein FACUT_13211 [Fusarium acutatum]|uniref:Uncharacterized protein n=1 Tax=Fusarium acutatum TaxID=78861 RepID=A0A8H4JC25_9HYPO|nr:hypothetical protein FACUT_13211 [Fusarium acutatum]
MSAPNNNPPPPKKARRPKREIDGRLLESIEARYAENAEVTLEMVTEIIGDEDPVGDEGWDQAAEDRITVSWEMSSRKRSSDKVGTRGNNDDPLRELWRFCLRFMKQAPPIMLSPVNGLQFMPTRQKSNFDISSDLFTQAACVTMAQLVVHPLWSGNHRPFIDALIFAALCRVDAKANISLTLQWPAHCPVIQGLNARLTEAANTRQPLPDTLQKLHIAAREAVHRRGDVDKESVFSEALFCIGKNVVAESASEAELAQLRQGIVPFQGKDLNAIKKALDDMIFTDGRMPFSVDDIHAVFKFVGHRGEIPSRQLLQSLDARACKQLSGEGTPASRIQEETEEANRSRPIRQGRDRSRSPMAQRLDRLAIRSRSRSRHRSPDSFESDRDFRLPEQRRSSTHRDDNINRSLADETQEYNVYFQDDVGYMPEVSEFASQVEAEESSRRLNLALPSPRVARDLRPPLSQALATDEIGQVRRELDELAKRIRAGETERDRLIEKLKTRQAETHKVFKRRHAEALKVLAGEYEDDLQTARSEHANAITALRSEHAATIASLKTELHNGLQAVMSQCNEQAGLIKTLQEENERLRQTAQAAPAQTAERTPTPVEAPHSDVSEHREPSQDTETLASVLSGRPEGVSFPTLDQRPPVVRVTASADGRLWRLGL